jgi:hypothetical protein
VGYEKYIKCISGLNKKIYERYDNNIYSNRVFVNYDTFVIDRDSGFPKVDGMHTNAVHPSYIGYKELIRGTLNTINRIYQP